MKLTDRVICVGCRWRTDRRRRVWEPENRDPWGACNKCEGPMIPQRIYSRVGGTKTSARKSS